jgi:hypothetical protein
MLVLPRKPVDKVTDLIGEEGVRTVEGLVRVANTLLTTYVAFFSFWNITVFEVGPVDMNAT